MNSKELVDKLSKPKTTVDAAVRSLQKDPDNFDEQTAERVTKIVGGSNKKQLEAASPSSSAKAKQKQVSVGDSKVDAALRNARLADEAITSEQVAAFLQNAREQGQVLGSLQAINFFLGMHEGSALTKAELFQLSQSGNNEFWDKLLGKNEAMLEGEVPATAYQQNQDTPSLNYLQAWRERTSLGAAYEND
jgi:hypothetical protein